MDKLKRRQVALKQTAGGTKCVFAPTRMRMRTPAHLHSPLPLDHLPYHCLNGLLPTQPRRQVRSAARLIPMLVFVLS